MTAPTGHPVWLGTGPAQPEGTPSNTQQRNPGPVTISGARLLPPGLLCVGPWATALCCICAFVWASRSSCTPCMAHPARPVLGVCEGVMDAPYIARAGSPGYAPTGGDSPPGLGRAQFHHRREPAHLLQCAPHVLPDLVRQTDRMPRLKRCVSGHVKPRRQVATQGHSLTIPQDMPSRAHAGRRARQSISTNAPTARAVTPTVVRAGRRSSGK